MKIFCAPTSLFLMALISPAFVTSAAAQSSIAPTLIPVNGELRTSTGEPRTGTVVLAISLYDGKDDPAPRWIEYQVVTLDANGKYDVQFGATGEDGLPADLFTNATSVRWLGVSVENEPEQPRAMLVSVPYAVKASTAETLAGKTASDFVLTTNLTDEVKAVLREEEEGSQDRSNPGTTAVTANFIQKGTGSGTATTDSNVIEVNGNVGIGTTSPGAPLDVRGGSVHIDFTSGAHGFTVGSVSVAGPRVTTGYKMTEDFGFTDVYNDSTVVYKAYRFNAANIILNNESGGNVGINTTAPGAKLHVSGGSILLDNTQWFRWKDSAGAAQNVARLSDADVLTIAPGKSGGPIYFTNFAATANNVAFLDNGNVGIGTTAPTTKLHVAGAATITGNLTVDGNIAAKYQDVAEWVDSAEPLEPGSIVVIDDGTTNRVKRAARAYDSRVVGAVSPHPGLVLGEPGPGKVLVAQSGRVRVKADARYGAIRPGDLLVTSPTAGHAMRSRPISIGGHTVHRPGTVIGKALEGLRKGSGEILVLLTLQ